MDGRCGKSQGELSLCWSLTQCGSVTFGSTINVPVIRIGYGPIGSCWTCISLDSKIVLVGAISNMSITEASNESPVAFLVVSKYWYLSCWRWVPEQRATIMCDQAHSRTNPCATEYH